MQLFKKLSVLLFMLALTAGSPTIFAQKAKPAPKTAAPSFGNVEGVTARQLKDYLTFIASDELEGRDTPSRGLDIAAMFIAQHLASWGIRPAGDNGSYFQKVPLSLEKVVARDTRMELGGQSYEYGKDFLTSITSASINNAQVVFAGYGWVIKSKNINAYQGIDVNDDHDRSVHLFNMHLGLAQYDRRIQLGTFLESHPFHGLYHDTPVIVGGDLNDVWGNLGALLAPSGFRGTTRAPRTFPAWGPLRALDSIYVRGRLELQHLARGEIELAKRASDHRPLIAYVEMHAPSAA